MNQNQQIALNIILFRQRKGWTQKELAEKCGLNQPQLSGIESGKRSTGIDILCKIAEVLGCRMEMILNQ